MRPSSATGIADAVVVARQRDGERRRCPAVAARTSATRKASVVRPRPAAGASDARRRSRAPGGGSSRELARRARSSGLARSSGSGVVVLRLASRLGRASAWPSPGSCAAPSGPPLAACSLERSSTASSRLGASSRISHTGTPLGARELGDDARRRVAHAHLVAADRGRLDAGAAQLVGEHLGAGRADEHLGLRLGQLAPARTRASSDPRSITSTRSADVRDLVGLAAGDEHRAAVVGEAAQQAAAASACPRDRGPRRARRGSAPRGRASSAAASPARRAHAGRQLARRGARRAPAGRRGAARRRPRRRRGRPCAAQIRRWSRSRVGGVQAMADQHPDVAAAAARARRRACRGSSRCPTSAATCPTSIRSVVVLPAPSWPTSPTSSPAWTSKETSSTATARRSAS